MLTLLMVVFTPTQIGIRVGGIKKSIIRVDSAGQEVTAVKEEGGFHVTPGDAFLAITFLVWAAATVLGGRPRPVRPPFPAAFVFVGIVLASALHAAERGPGLREFAQLAAYFIAGWVVLANCIDTRRRLRAAVDLFTIVTAAIVLIALCQYRAAASGNAFKVAGLFENRNVLGAFFAFSLPFLFVLGLYEERLWQRFALFLTAAVGLGVTLSGGALLGAAVGILFSSALHSRRALIATIAAGTLGVLLVPRLASLPRHSDVVLSSIRPYLQSNFLDRRKGEPQLLGEPVVAVRYTHWYVATRLIRKHLRFPFLGTGPGTYHRNLSDAYKDAGIEKPSGQTDDVSGFNITADEPDSFNMFLVLLAESGPLALAALLWLGLSLLGQGVRNHFESKDKFGRALGLGTAAAVVGAALCGVFSNILVRGVGMPFIFVVLSGILWAKLADSPPARSGDDGRPLLRHREL